MAVFEKVPIALNCWVVPTAMVLLAGVTAIDVTSATVSVVKPGIPLKVAVIVVLPGAAPAVASPAVLIVAIPVLDELQVTNDVKS